MVRQVTVMTCRDEENVRSIGGDNADNIGGGYCNLENSDAKNLQRPLYDNSPISIEASMYSTYLYAIKNKLSYQATTELLALMRIHFPSPNHFPPSFHLLKKYLTATTPIKITNTAPPV